MISALQVETTVEKPKSDAVPRLENGDHLTRAEFERRCVAMPGVQKAELSEGMVITPSPVSYQDCGLVKHCTKPTHTWTHGE